MSSHHIIREKQEPALLALGLNDFEDDQLGQLLEWSPTVIATTDTAENLISRAIKVDWIITGALTGPSQSDVKLLPADEDNLTGIALKFLVDNGYPSVNAVTDDLRLDEYEPFIQKLDIVIFHHRHKIYAIASGFSKWKAADETITLFTRPVNLASAGLIQTGETTWKTIADGFFSLRFDNLRLFIGEEM